MTNLPEAFVTITHGVRGYFSVLLVQDDEGHVPWNSGQFSYSTERECEADAALWAKAEDVPFIHPEELRNEH